MNSPIFVPYHPSISLEMASRILTFTLLLIGVVITLATYLYGRSLFLDEANVGLVLETVSWPGLFRPLPFEQYAPPLFLVLAKGSVLLFGHHEWGLRLVPLLAGLGSLIAMLTVLQQLDWQWEVRSFVIGWMALSPYMVRYATECKPYIWDVLITLLLISLALRLNKMPPRGWSWLTVALVMITIPWASMPAVFLLAAWGGMAIWTHLYAKDYRNAVPWILVSLTGFISFLSYHQLVISHNMQESLLINYHRPYFLPLHILQEGELSRALDLLNDLWTWAYGHTAISLFSGLVLALAGFILLWRSNRFLAVLLAGPFILACVASLAQQFTLIPRVNLFMVPLFILLAGAGIEMALNRWQPGRSRWILVPLWLLCLSSFLGKWPDQLDEPETEDLHGMMTLLAQHHEQLPWYVHWNAKPALRYYTEFHADRQRFDGIQTHLLPWMEPGQIPGTIGQEPGFWLVFSHLISEQARHEQHQIAEHLLPTHLAVDSVQTTGALAILYTRRGPPE